MMTRSYFDCKASFDDNALYRQRGVAEMKDENEYDPLELEAARHDLNYVKLDGNIGLMVNGAGLSMATMDIIKYYGGEAANFMDVAGAATPERVAAAFKLIYKDPDVQGILINIFGGMMRCNDIATGLVNASKEVGLDKPLVVRLEGTNVEMGMDILKNSGFPIKPVDTMEQAAKDVVTMVKEKNSWLYYLQKNQKNYLSRIYWSSRHLPLGARYSIQHKYSREVSHQKKVDQNT